MTDEEIVEAMIDGLHMPGNNFTRRRIGRALSIAKPLVSREAREMALQHAMIAVQGCINAHGMGLVNEYAVSSLREAKAAIFALSNNPEVGG